MQTKLNTEPPKGRPGTSVIDCDVHVHPASEEEIRRFLKPPWDKRFRFYRSELYKRTDLSPEEMKLTANGKRVVTDPQQLRENWIGPQSVAHALLLPRAEVSVQPDRGFACATAAGFNDWLADKWLDRHNADGVFKGSITVAHQAPEEAAEEIARWAGHPHFVQVLLDSGARAPFGQPHYYPIYEACQRAGYPVVIHPGGDGMGRNLIASQGYPAHYAEFYTGLSFSMQSHLVSMLTEGVFERFPELKVVIAEGGALWLPPLMWRLDTEYKGLRSEIPWVRRLPSEYLKDHVRFTTHPLERPASASDMTDALEMLDLKELLLYGSDYPDGTGNLPADLPDMDAAARRRILHDNAREFYRL